MTRGAAFTLGRALAVRAGPGLTNLIALTVAAKAVTPSTYGIFSLTLATVGVLSNILFGAITLPIVAQYALHRERNDHGSYVWTIFCAAFAIVVLVSFAGLIASLFVPLVLYAAAALMITSIHAITQEINRARHSIFSYAGSDLVQSVSFLVATLTLLNEQSSPMHLVLLFTLSYAPALAVSIWSLRDLKPARPLPSIAIEVLKVGRWLVINNLTENLLFVGSRYLVLGEAGARTLGVFSFAIDLAQRTVAFMVNAANFVYVPRAFSALAKDGAVAFIRVLKEGVAISLLAAICSLILIVSVSYTPYGQALAPEVFDAVVFSIIATAAVTNRIKKLFLDSVAIATHQSSRIAVGNLMGACAGLAAVWLLVPLGGPIAVAAGYLLGYVAILGVTAFLLRAEWRALAKPASEPDCEGQRS